MWGIYIHIWQRDASPMQVFVHLTSTTCVLCSYSTCLGFVLYTHPDPSYLFNHRIHLESYNVYGYILGYQKHKVFDDHWFPIWFAQYFQSQGDLEYEGLMVSNYIILYCKIFKVIEKNMEERKWDSIGWLLGFGPM